MIEKTFVNNNRNGLIRKNRYGEFETFIGYVDNHYCSGMDVVELKVYKTEKRAIKFVNKWLEE